MGVTIDGANHTAAKNAGFTHIDPVSTEAVNYEKLRLGRIDAWITTANNAQWISQRFGGDSDFFIGAIVEPYRAWIAASREIDPKVAAQWRQALESMRKDGTWERIAKASGYIPPQHNTKI